MSKELLRELKDAGFPQHEAAFERYIHDKFEVERLYQPPLSELIAWCGDDFLNLNLSYIGRNGEDRWHAVGRECNNHVFGSTPEEAVARLGIAIHKK